VALRGAIWLSRAWLSAMAVTLIRCEHRSSPERICAHQREKVRTVTGLRFSHGSSELKRTLLPR
jgi:hypothetical protein